MAFHAQGISDLINNKEESSNAPTPASDQSIDGSDHGLGSTFFKIYTALMVHIQIMNDNKVFTFETEEGFFLKLSVASLCVSVLVSKILSDHAKSNLVRFPKMENILSSVALFLGIIAQLSLLLVIFISHHQNWLRYLIISGFFVSMVAYTFRDYIIVKWLGEDHILNRMVKKFYKEEDKKTSPPSTEISRV